MWYFACFIEIYAGFKDRKDTRKGEVAEGALKESLEGNYHQSIA